MHPFEFHNRLDAAPEVDGPMAAVMVGVHPGPGAFETLLIRRPVRSSDPWSGHIAFPGGRAEGNETAAQTAQRECHEEVGFAPEMENLLGFLPPVRAVGRGRVRNLSVIPVVFALHDRPSLTLQPAEVEHAMWVDLDPLRHGHVDIEHPYTHEGVVHRFPAFDVEGRAVWGMTYRILVDFFQRLDIEVNVHSADQRRLDGSAMQRKRSDSSGGVEGELPLQIDKVR